MIRVGQNTSALVSLPAPTHIRMTGGTETAGYARSANGQLLTCARRAVRTITLTWRLIEGENADMILRAFHKETVILRLEGEMSAEGTFLCTGYEKTLLRPDRCELTVRLIEV